MFDQRSHKKELLDGADYAPAELEQNLRELHAINYWLGGYAVSLGALRKVLAPKKASVVVDIGSGGGDTALAIRSWCLKNSYNVQVKGIDINPACVSYSTSRASGAPGVQFICDDYRKVKTHVPEADILHASLFLHHLSDAEILELLRFAKENRYTLVINDLMRHPVAYYSIRVLTGLLSRSRLIKNDAPLSVLRGFKTSEWRRLMKEAGISNYTISSRWAFRHLIIVHND